MRNVYDISLLQDYECKITSLQEQVERYSMMSSMTPDDFDDEEEIFGGY